MEAFKILFTTGTGLMSLGVIVFIIGMAWFFARMFSRKMREDAAAAKAAAGNRPASQAGSH
ncbi:MULTISPECIES: DUF3149 domain-containing protein [Cupriavidus]|uniref:DUF3149 domain-containing protein n=2 Tax=Cupriavidus TaxID=106589 RepID=Q46YA2_CUPPJ|nr:MULTISPECIES: DUF3149 domain-containing protein [Cupriavidus]QYY30738.1 DUF3149 domain-containing protein [Cupriavidus pinatubonensis]TPQ43325.1 DUF3149 domain-containing protein [Cupriavidus pinatubonensis]CAG2143402.1 hypothetical protein LMG26411_02371 [Cupriavidus numazuensis]